MLPGVAQVIEGTILVIVTVTSTPELLPGYSVPSVGTYVAEMVCDPAARVVVVNWAQNMPGNGWVRVTLPMSAAPSKKFTVPVGSSAPEPGGPARPTFAVKVTA